MARREVLSQIRLTIGAGQAKPSPPVGPALGQAGLNIMAFCKEFNAATSHIKDQVPVPTEITAYTDKTFEFETKMPPVSYFVKQAAGVEEGAGYPGHERRAQITLMHVYHIARVKQRDMPLVSFPNVCKQVIGSCKSLGIEVLGKEAVERLREERGLDPPSSQERPGDE